MRYANINLVLAKRIQDLRKAKGSSIRGLGRKSSVTHGHLRFIEMANISPSVGTLSRVATALDVRPADLINSGQSDAEAVYELLRDRPDLVASVLQKLRSATPLQIQNA